MLLDSLPATMMSPKKMRPRNENVCDVPNKMPISSTPKISSEVSVLATIARP